MLLNKSIPDLLYPLYFGLTISLGYVPGPSCLKLESRKERTSFYWNIVGLRSLEQYYVVTYAG